LVSKDLAEKLYRENIRYVQKVVNTIEKDKWRREDIVQEVFFKAFQSLAQLRDLSKFRPWVSRIAVNQCYEYYRRNREVSVDNIAVAAVDRGSNHDDLLDRDMVTRALNQLKPEERELIILKYYLDWDSADIAVVLDITLNNLNVRLHRVRSKLRRLMEIHS
jgi:RNA polymerase sigma-70 factor (ECF subfamily)